MKRMEFLRATFLCLLWTVGLVLLLCEGENVVSLLLAKLIGLGVCVIMAFVGKRWLEDGKMPWTARVLDE